MQQAVEQLEALSKKKQSKFTDWSSLFSKSNDEEATLCNLVALYGYTVRLSNRKWWCAKLFKTCKALCRCRQYKIPEMELLLQNDANFCAGICRLAYKEHQFDKDWWQYVAWHCRNTVTLNTLNFLLRSGIFDEINKDNPDWVTIMQSSYIVPGIEPAEYLSKFAGVPLPSIESNTEVNCQVCFDTIQHSVYELMGGVCEPCLRKSVEPMPGFPLTSATFKHPLMRTQLTDQVISALSMRAAYERTGLRDVDPDIIPQYNFLLMIQQLKELLGENWYEMLDRQEVTVGACIDCDHICTGPIGECGAGQMPFIVVCPPCEQERQEVSNRSNDRLECPNCNLSLEHAGGCFHMACCQAHGVYCTGADCNHGMAGCGAHFCRFCKVQFEGHNAYEHRCPLRSQDEGEMTYEEELTDEDL